MANTRVLSGIRSSGTLHWAIIYGAPEEWQTLQHEYECVLLHRRLARPDY